MRRGYSAYFDKSLAWTFAVALAAASVLVGCVGPSVTGSFDRTLAVSGPVQLEVHNGSGLVEIRTGQDGQVRIHGNYSVWGFAFENARAGADDLTNHPPIEQVGNAVQVGLSGGRLHDARVDYTIYVPAQTQARVTVGSGRMEIVGIQGPAELESGSGRLNAREIKEDVRATTGSGGVELEDIGGPVNVSAGSGSLTLIRVGGDIVAECGAGHVTVDHPGGRVNTRTRSGNIEISEAAADVRVVTGSGRVRVNGNPAPGKYWELVSSSGGVSLEVPSDASFRLYAHATSGRIHTNLPLVLEQEGSSRAVRGSLGSGAARVEINTHSGRIEIR
jgi:Putative adhesin